MKTLFYLGLAGLALFEVLNVYFIMPMPGSQRIASLEVAYFLHTWRWIFRLGLFSAVAAGSFSAFRGRRKWFPTLAVVIVGAIAYLFNFQMTAERIFQEPRQLAFKPRAENSVREASVVIGVEHGGEARAYPVRYLVYHHQVQDVMGGKPVMVTYCSVCRTARVFEPVVDGRAERFRLVGMDHFNAMFEDATTGSWWRQATGEAVTGRRKGALLPGVPSTQLTLRKWFELHPAGVVMQPDEASAENYDPAGRFEHGHSGGNLTRTDRGSWNDKSWVVGVRVDGASKAYDWNSLKKRRVINDTVGGTPIVVALAKDGVSFVAFERGDPALEFTLENDVLAGGGRFFDFSGRDLAAPAQRLKIVEVHQEFWHSWRTFQPESERDGNAEARKPGAL